MTLTKWKEYYAWKVLGKRAMRELDIALKNAELRVLTNNAIGETVRQCADDPSKGEDMKTFRIYYETTVAAESIVSAIKAFEQQIKEDVKNDENFGESILRGVAQVTSSGPAHG